MVYSKKRFLSLFIFCLTIVASLYSQETAETLDSSNSETVYQVLKWEDVQHASYYEIVIERQTLNNEWEAYAKYETSENELGLNLPVGYYRYDIVVYNVLRKAELVSQWYEFAVNKAYKPVVNYVLPGEITLNDETDGKIKLVAENILYNTRFTLEHSNGTILYGAVVKIDGDSVLLDFDEHRLQEGEYTINVINPGGLSDATKTLEVKKDKIYDIAFFGGYTATYFLPGGTILPNLTNNFLPLGFHGNFEYIPVKKSMWEVGFGFSFRTITLKQPLENEYSISGNLYPISLYAGYTHSIIANRLFIHAHVGGGINLLHNLYLYENGAIQGDPLTAIALLVTVGPSLQFYATENIFIDMSVDYNCSFFLGDTYLQMILPSVSIGLKL